MMSKIKMTIAVMSPIWFMASASAWAVEKSSTTFKAFVIPLNGQKIEWDCIDWEEFVDPKEWTYTEDLTCVREIGFREDGLVVWRRPPEAIKDAQEREQKSKPYK